MKNVMQECELKENVSSRFFNPLKLELGVQCTLQKTQMATLHAIMWNNLGEEWYQLLRYNNVGM